jgi:dTDP-4-amino-4,6-dideoxygalactose transaminase
MFKKRYKNINAKFVSDNAITLPSAPSMKVSDIKKVCYEVNNFFKKN